MNDIDLTFIDQTIERLGADKHAVIPILQAMQDHYRYLPESAMLRVCDSTHITPATIKGIATFYDMFRLRPVGKNIIRVCQGTACHVKGSPLVDAAFRRILNILPDDDTTADRQFTVEPVACLGCCTLAPVVQIENITFGHVTPDRVEKTIQDFLNAPQQTEDDAQRYAAAPTTTCQCTTTDTSQPLTTKTSVIVPTPISDTTLPTTTPDASVPPEDIPEIRVGLGSCCISKGSGKLYDALQQAVNKTNSNTPIAVKRVGCVGMCHITPMIEVKQPFGQSTFYSDVELHHAPQIVTNHFAPRSPFKRLTNTISRTFDRFLSDYEDSQSITRRTMEMRDPAVTAFLDKQKHITTQGFGNIDPMDLDEYITSGGFNALNKSLNDDPTNIIKSVTQSGLRGRGGAGFPTGTKWQLVSEAQNSTKYVICNGDEGDPGAFMDRMLLESFPYRIIEGLAIAAVAVGAHDCIFYIRHEYPLAVRRIRRALEICLERKIIGKNAMDSSFNINISIMEGAGAFVCGEETALIASLEGERGQPRLRPPYPSKSGLRNKPTLVNNVETLATIPWIINQAPQAYSVIGTQHSKGTKVFALAGKITRGGLIEVPLGTTIRDIVHDIGGGPLPDRQFKAVQIGGPSGACVPAHLDHIPIDYEALQNIGAIMGSGGLVVLDNTDCMVDIARYFLQFTQDQSCGSCTFCRVGTRRMREILDRICQGNGRPNDLDELEQLGHQVADSSLCGLGQTAPNPVLSTLKYFRDEYEAHLNGICPAGRCTDLIKYNVTDKCIGCTLCAQHCPVDAIQLTPYQRHVIDNDLCTKCDTCRTICPENAIEVI